MFCRKGVLRNFEKFSTPLVAVSEEWKKPGDNLYSGKRHENKIDRTLGLIKIPVRHRRWWRCNDADNNVSVKCILWREWRQAEAIKSKYFKSKEKG